MAHFKVQHGVKNVPLAGTTATIDAVNSLTKAALLNGNNGYGNSHNDLFAVEADDTCATVDLTAVDTITFTRVAGSINESRFCSYEVLEQLTNGSGGPNEFIVRSRNTVTINAGTEDATDTLDNTPTSIHDCIVFILGVMTTVATDGGHTTGAVCFISGTNTLNVKRAGGIGDVTVETMTVEFTGSNWTVLHGSTDPNGFNTDTISITLRSDADGISGSAADVGSWDNACIFHQFRGDDGDANQAVADIHCTLFPGADTSTVDVEFHSGHDGTRNVAFVSVLVHPEMMVTRYVTTEGENEDTVDIDITSAGLTDLEQMFLIHSRWASGAGAFYSRGWSQHLIIDLVTARLFGSDGMASASTRLQVVDLQPIAYREVDGEAFFPLPEIEGTLELIFTVTGQADFPLPEIEGQLVLVVTVTGDAFFPLPEIEAELETTFAQIINADLLNVEVTAIDPAVQRLYLLQGIGGLGVDVEVFDPTYQFQFTMGLLDVDVTAIDPAVLRQNEIVPDKVFVEVLALAPTVVNSGCTPVPETIGTGQFYTTIDAWEAATDIDISEATGTAERRIGLLASQNHLPAAPVTSGTIWTIQGATTDTDCYRELTAQPGAEYDPVTGLGARIVQSAWAAGGIILEMLEDDFHLSYIGIREESIPINTVGRVCYRVSGGAEDVFIDACYAEDFVSFSGIGFEAPAGAGNARLQITNCIAHGAADGMSTGRGFRIGFDIGQSSPSVYNCAAYRVGSNHPTAGIAFIGIRTTDTASIVRNCIALETDGVSTGGTNTDFVVAGTNESHNISSDTSAVGTGSINSAIAGDIWIDPDDSDFRLKLGSDALNAGINLAAFFETDFVGGMHNSGGNGWEIGPYDEFASGFTTTINVGLLGVGVEAIEPEVNFDMVLNLGLLEVDVTLFDPFIQADTPGPPSQPEAAAGIMAAEAEAIVIAAAGSQETGIVAPGLEASDLRAATSTLE